MSKLLLILSNTELSLLYGEESLFSRICISTSIRVNQTFVTNNGCDICKEELAICAYRTEGITLIVFNVPSAHEDETIRS